MKRAGLFLLVLATGLHGASAASRPLYGQTLRVAWVGDRLPRDPLLADTPEEAALLRLWTEGVCHDEEGGVGSALTQVTQPSSTQLVLRLRGKWTFPGGGPLTSMEIARAWQRLAEPATRSPYRGLLAPVRGKGAYLTGAALRADALVLPLEYPFPDLAEALCHPALSVPSAGNSPGLGPYRTEGAFEAAGARLAANPRQPMGRPFPDALEVTVGSERQAARQFAHHQVQLRLGAGINDAPSPALLYATYVLFRPEVVGPGFRGAFDAAVDLEQLTKLFVPAPSKPLSGLLPEASSLAGRPASAARPSGAAARPSFTLLFDESLDFAQPVAERLQVKLNDVGYHVRILGLPRAELRARWAQGNFDAVLMSLLLPRPPAAALAVMLELAGNPGGALDRELPMLGAMTDAQARGEKAQERARALLPQLPLLPLFVQGARMQADDSVQGLRVGPDGVPRLDNIFLLPPRGDALPSTTGP